MIIIAHFVGIIPLLSEKKNVEKNELEHALTICIYACMFMFSIFTYISICVSIVCCSIKNKGLNERTQLYHNITYPFSHCNIHDLRACVDFPYLIEIKE